MPALSERQDRLRRIAQAKLGAKQITREQFTQELSRIQAEAEITQQVEKQIEEQREQERDLERRRRLGIEQQDQVELARREALVGLRPSGMSEEEARVQRGIATPAQRGRLLIEQIETSRQIAPYGYSVDVGGVSPYYTREGVKENVLARTGEGDSVLGVSDVPVGGDEKAEDKGRPFKIPVYSKVGGETKFIEGPGAVREFGLGVVETGKEVVDSATRFVGKVTYDPFETGRFNYPVSSNVITGKTEYAGEVFVPVGGRKNLIFDPDIQGGIATLGLIAVGGGALGKVGVSIVETGLAAAGGFSVSQAVTAKTPREAGRKTAEAALYLAPLAPKIKEIDFFTIDTLSAISRSKRGAVFRGGKRISPISKAELRKLSYGALRDKIFYDVQKGEVGIRVKSSQLKQQFVKERVIRFGAEEGKIKIVEVKDVLLGSTTRQRTLTTRFDWGFDRGISYTGKQTQPGFSKLYPKGFGSQSLSGKGSGELKGVLIIEHSRKTNLYQPQEKIMFSEKALPRTRQPSGVSVTGLVIEKTIPPQVKYIEPPEVVRGGFRRGVGEELFTRVKEKALLRERIKFISDISLAELPTQKILPKTILKVSPLIESKLKVDSGFLVQERIAPKTILKVPSISGSFLTPVLKPGVFSLPKQRIVAGVAIRSKQLMRSDYISEFDIIKPLKLKITKPKPDEDKFKFVPFSFKSAPPTKPVDYVPDPIKIKDPDIPPPEDGGGGGFGFELPKFKFIKPKKEQRKGVRKLRYTPSLVGVAFKIKAKGKKGVFSGLELRGV